MSQLEDNSSIPTDIEQDHSHATASHEEGSHEPVLAVVHYKEKLVEITDPAITLGDVCEALGVPQEESGVGVRDRETGQIVATLPYDPIVRRRSRKKEGTSQTKTTTIGMNDEQKKNSEDVLARMKGSLSGSKKKRKRLPSSSSSSFFPLQKARKTAEEYASSSGPDETGKTLNGSCASVKEEEYNEDEETDDEEDEENNNDNRIEAYELFRAFEVETREGETDEKYRSTAVKSDEGDGGTTDHAVFSDGITSNRSSSLLPTTALLQQLVNMGMSELFFPSLPEDGTNNSALYQPQQPPYFLSNTVYPTSIYSPHRPALVSSFTPVEEEHKGTLIINGRLVGRKEDEDEERNLSLQQWGAEEWTLACGYRSGAEMYSIPPTPWVEE